MLPSHRRLGKGQRIPRWLVGQWWVNRKAIGFCGSVLTWHIWWLEAD